MSTRSFIAKQIGKDACAAVCPRCSRYLDFCLAVPLYIDAPVRRHAVVDPGDNQITDGRHYRRRGANGQGGRGASDSCPTVFGCDKHRCRPAHRTGHLIQPVHGYSGCFLGRTGRKVQRQRLSVKTDCRRVGKRRRRGGDLDCHAVPGVYTGGRNSKRRCAGDGGKRPGRGYTAAGEGWRKVGRKRCGYRQGQGTVAVVRHVSRPAGKLLQTAVPGVQDEVFVHLDTAAHREGGMVLVFIPIPCGGGIAVITLHCSVYGDVGCIRTDRLAVDDIVQGKVVFASGGSVTGIRCACHTLIPSKSATGFRYCAAEKQTFQAANPSISPPA